MADHETLQDWVDGGSAGGGGATSASGVGNTIAIVSWSLRELPSLR